MFCIYLGLSGELILTFCWNKISFTNELSLIFLFNIFSIKKKNVFQVNRLLYNAFISRLSQNTFNLPYRYYFLCVPLYTVIIFTKTLTWIRIVFPVMEIDGADQSTHFCKYNTHPRIFQIGVVCRYDF